MVVSERSAKIEVWGKTAKFFTALIFNLSGSDISLKFLQRKLRLLFIILRPDTLRYIPEYHADQSIRPHRLKGHLHRHLPLETSLRRVKLNNFHDLLRRLQNHKKGHIPVFLSTRFPHSALIGIAIRIRQHHFIATALA